MDFSQVKSLTIPEGEVTKITDSSGKVLWQKSLPKWHTIWTGRKAVKTIANNTITGAESNFVSTASGTGLSPRLRITFSFSRGQKYDTTDEFGYYVNSAKDTASEPSSPVEIEAVLGDDNAIILGYRQTAMYKFTAKALLTKTNDIANDRVNLNLEGKFNLSNAPDYYKVY